MKEERFAVCLMMGGSSRQDEQNLEEWKFYKLRPENGVRPGSLVSVHVLLDLSYHPTFIHGTGTRGMTRRLL